MSQIHVPMHQCTYRYRHHRRVSWQEQAPYWSRDSHAGLWISLAWHSWTYNWFLSQMSKRVDMEHSRLPLCSPETIRIILPFTVRFGNITKLGEVVTKDAVHVKESPSQTSFVTRTGARLVYNKLTMSSIDLTRKHWSTYEDSSRNRPCYDESKGSSDGKQSKCEFHDNLKQKLMSWKSSRTLAVLPKPLHSL